jgi:tetrapyrrole methylase family protein / MazG family protein
VVPSTAFDNLLAIVRRLRKDCPWDSQQTHASIRQNLIEEAYETVEAIDRNNLEELKYELGDLLLHILLHAVIAEEENAFTIDDIVFTISDKLIRRHPHVFGDVKVSGHEEVKINWEKIKLSEGRKSILDGIPSKMPSLVRAYRLQDKASKTGFDWNEREDCWNKVTEEINEFHDTVLNENPADRQEEEFGDVLFSLVNYARLAKINPEDALRRSNEKFIYRFQKIESELERRGKDIHSVTLEEMDKIWDAVKSDGDTE